MSSPESAPATNPETARLGALKPPLLVLSWIWLTALLLSTVHVFDWSVFVCRTIPRGELCGASLAALGYVATSLVKPREGSWRRMSGIALFLPLSAAAFLALEATTLVLCPNPFEFGEAWTPFVPQTLLVGVMASPGTAEVATALIACTIAVSFVGAIASASSRLDFDRTIHTVTIATLAAGVLTILVPVIGPMQGVMPHPASIDGAAASSAVDVPRTGFICLPAVVAFALLWSLWRGSNDPAGSRKSVRNTTTGLLCLVVALELVMGRYALASVCTAGVVVLCAQTIITFGGLLLKRRPTAAIRAATSQGHSDADQASHSSGRVRLLLTVVFFFSGMAALVYQVVFAKGLALTFGSTSHASTIVLATYMGGLALGTWAGGRWAANLAKPVLGYALAELGIAGLCSVAPFTLKAARFLYVAAAEGSNPSEPWLIALQLGLGALVLVPPTWLMGLTLPLLTRQFLDADNTLGTSAGLLYTANTLGAALGAGVTGYLILPTIGIGRSLFLAVTVNVSVALFAIIAARIGRNGQPPLRVGSSEHGQTAAEAPTHWVAATKAPLPPTPEPAQVLATTSAPSDESTQGRCPAKAERLEVLSAIVPSEAHPLRVGLVATIQLTVGGFVTFGLETTFIHLLATVAGTSAYAFSLMLLAFLVGLSVGSSLGRKWLPKPRNLPQALLLCQLILAATLLVACRVWDYLPAYFAAFGDWPYTLTFASREFVRFVVCLVVMLPPAICIGAQFPIAIEAIGFGWPNAKIQSLGRASALNTVGNIVGALGVGFVALPRLGSHRTLALLTLLCLALSALALWIIERERRAVWLGLVAAVVLGLIVQPPQFDLGRLSAGGNIYFKPQYYGRIIDHTESLDGGLTAVAVAYETSATPVKTLLTNGKFQGNDRRDSSGEMVAQTSFALAPLLHTADRGSALVIGFGTGTTTRVLDEAGFGRIAVAELSGDIVTLADRHFSTINHGVIHRPNVQVYVTDGRNFLLLDRNRYDLISIELSSIWFAGAANLYNDEFYSLVEPRLTDRGVLQQWVQLHRLSHRDVMSILVTLRRHFPRTWLYFLGKQGIIVACKFDCSPRAETLELLERTERLQAALSVFGDGLASVMRGRMLTPDGINRLIDDYRHATGQSIESLISSDDNLYLEYSTPRGNVRDYDQSIADNAGFLSRFRAASLLDGTRLQHGTLN
jgi:predicted membrane-bound spermidine synthase